MSEVEEKLEEEEEGGNLDKKMFDKVRSMDFGSLLKFAGRERERERERVGKS